MAKGATKPGDKRDRLSWAAIEERALLFSKTWVPAFSEKSHKHDWIRALLNVFVKDASVGSFPTDHTERTVKTTEGDPNFIDYYWKGVIAIEMKTKGKDLGYAWKRLKEYMECLPEGEEPPDLMMVSDFENIEILHRHTGQEITFKTVKLKKYIKHFAAVADYELEEDLPISKEAVNKKAAEKMANLHTALERHKYKGHELQVYVARLLFCLFADDTGIFTQYSFYHYIKGSPENGSELSGRLDMLFQNLNEPLDDRSENSYLTTYRGLSFSNRGVGLASSIDPADFRYVNGGLFAERLKQASFDGKMRQTLLDCLGFDWGQISPAIFGSMFQGVMGGEERRDIGAHYTSEENILKLINPLFMDSLREEFAAAKASPAKNALSDFHRKLSGLKFLDPACGCGNFLIIAYRELRRLEHGVIKEESRRTGKLNLDEGIAVKVEQFAGIEIKPWACQLAKTGMWLMDHLMNNEAAEEFCEPYVRLPLKEEAKIVEGNALRIDWDSVVPRSELSYILGNPPYSGARIPEEEAKQKKADMENVFGKGKGAGNLDYVAAWFRKATDYIGDSPIKAAFVSTNSITQGEQVTLLWKPLLERGVHINFAVPTFKWSNEAKGEAAVHCVIIGFSKEKTEPVINPYLVESPIIFIERRNKPLCDGVPELSVGNQVIDDGNYIFTDEEKAEFLRREPTAEKWLRKYKGSYEYINGCHRHILFLKHCPPNELRKMPECVKRVEAVRKFRSASKRTNTKKLADTPLCFEIENIPETEYLAVPETSSENRRYIPIGFLQPDVLASHAIRIGTNATPWHFGILTSSVHMAWVRAVCGRLKSDYRYSIDIVYNNFPWPNATLKQKKKIEALAQGILSARENARKDAEGKGSVCSLADLYDPNTMPTALAKAHEKLDNAVMNLYGFSRDTPEPAIVVNLMERYRVLVAAE